MKKVLLIAAAALLVFGVAGVANADIIHWCCTASGFWDTCEFYFNTSTNQFWGTWEGTVWYGSCGGSITGEADAIGGGGAHGYGTFDGDFQGNWEGYFIWVSDTCWGEYMASTNPPGAGEFWGSGCE